MIWFVLYLLLNLFEDVPAHKAARGKYGCAASNPDGAWARAQADYDQNDPGKPRKLPKRVKRVAPEDMVGLE